MPSGRIRLTEDDVLNWLRSELAKLQTQTTISLYHLSPEDEPSEHSIPADRTRAIIRTVIDLLSAGVDFVPLIRLALVKFSVVVVRPWSTQTVRPWNAGISAGQLNVLCSYL